MKLYILIADCGDGSSSLNYTLDATLIEKLRSYDGIPPDHAGFDGDGFSPKTLIVPDGSTYESLGISQWAVATAADYEGLE